MEYDHLRFIMWILYNFLSSLLQFTEMKNALWSQILNLKKNFHVAFFFLLLEKQKFIFMHNSMCVMSWQKCLHDREKCVIEYLSKHLSHDWQYLQKFASTIFNLDILYIIIYGFALDSYQNVCSCYLESV